MLSFSLLLRPLCHLVTSSKVSLWLTVVFKDPVHKKCVLSDAYNPLGRSELSHTEIYLSKCVTTECFYISPVKVGCLPVLWYYIQMHTRHFFEIRWVTYARQYNLQVDNCRNLFVIVLSPATLPRAMRKPERHHQHKQPRPEVSVRYVTPYSANGSPNLLMNSFFTSHLKHKKFRIFFFFKLQFLSPFSDVSYSPG